MKTLTQRILRHTLVATILTSSAAAMAQDANWIGGSGEWNNGANWDVLVAPGPLTNAIINGAVAVTYDAPMVEASVGTLRLSGAAILDINTNGFAVDGVANNALNVAQAGSKLGVNNNGVVTLTGGGVTLETNGVVTVSPGGTLSIQGPLRLGNLGGSVLSSFVTNYGGVLSALSTTINPGNAAPAQSSPSCRLVILGGLNDLGDVTILRSPTGSGGAGNIPLGSEGLVISNGVVRTTSLSVGGTLGNSWLTMLIANGTVTNAGAFSMHQVTSGRPSRFLQFGGVFQSIGDNVHLRGHTVNNPPVWYAVTGGTNIVQGFVVTDVGDIVGTVVLSNSAKIYVGSGGISMGGGNLSPNGTNILLNSGGIFGAQADWTGTVPMILTGGTFDAAALDGTPHNITISGALSGFGHLTKTGNGTLTLGGSNTYSGNTLINAGRLALDVTGFVSTSPQIVVGSNTVFDVSAVSGGFLMSASRTLGGYGVVTGAVSLAATTIINPGSGAQAGTLTFTNDLIATNGGSVFHFDLSGSPAGPGNDFIDIGGSLILSNVNTIEISGTLPVNTVYPLIHYGGSLIGGTSNFNISGASGILSNSAATKTIYLRVQTSVRSPTTVSWVGSANALSNVWDTIGRTNWSNAGVLDYFVPGDQVRFDAVGASHPLINIVETVSPGSVTVDSASSYTFAGDWQIGGATGLTKTNSGTLTIFTTNSFTGPTTIGGGVLEATLLADAAANSSIGSADNLVFAGGTLKYPGDTVAINRGATFNGNGTIEVSNSATALTIGGTLAGTGALTKTGPGTLVLTVGNSYSGGTLVNNGTLRVNSPGGAGTGGITNNGTTLLIGSAITLANVVHFNGTCTIDLDNVAGNTALDGAWAGSGTVNIINQENIVPARTFTIGGASGGNMSNFTGRINMGTCPGFLRFNDGGGDGSGPNFGSAAATFDLGTSTAILHARNGGTFNDLGALIGGPGTTLRGNTANSGIVTYSIGGNDASTLFEGTIINGSSPTAIVKTGTGKLTLTGNSTYSSTTTISNGTLQVDGTLGFTVVTVEGGTLSGIGSIGGPVTVNSAGTLAPGDSVGTLTFLSDLAIAGNLVIEVDKSLPQSNDVMTVSGFLAAGSGTITVSNLGPALIQGDTFTLFNQAVSGGSVLTVTGAGATWNNNLELNGSISVASIGVAQPKIGTITSSGGNVVINGSNGPTTGNYIVLTTTNVAAAVGTWTPILTNPFNADGTFSATNAIVPGTARSFYLIQVQ